MTIKYTDEVLLFWISLATNDGHVSNVADSGCGVCSWRTAKFFAVVSKSAGPIYEWDDVERGNNYRGGQ